MESNARCSHDTRAGIVNHATIKLIWVPMVPIFLGPQRSLWIHMNPRNYLLLAQFGQSDECGRGVLIE